MERNLLLLLFCLLVIKSSGQIKPLQLKGRWAGTYGNNQKNEPYYLSFAFSGDSVTTYTAYNKVYGHGKYTIIKNKLNLTYRVDNDVQQYECVGILYNDTTKTLAGNWRRISDVGTKYKYTQKGRWVMKPE